MASAQVLRKQEHLQAGKRRLEEFRKKKAADRAKKAASTIQTHVSDVSLNDKLQLETEHIRVTDSDGAGTSDGSDLSSINTVNNTTTSSKSIEISRESQQAYPNNTPAIPSFVVDDYISSSIEEQIHTKSQENDKYVAKRNGGLLYNNSLQKHRSNDFQEPKSKEDGDSMKVSTVANPISSEDSKSISGTRESVLEFGQNLQGSMISDFGEQKFSNSASGFPSLLDPPMQTSGYSEFSSVTNDTSSRRSRPSFLDSLNVPKASSGPLFQNNEPAKDGFASHSSQSNSINFLGPFPVEKSSNKGENMGTNFMLRSSNLPSANEYPASNNGDLVSVNSINENTLDKKQDFYSTKQNEDFAALEQHIEDLTQEKFYLQRALEASKALAESLASENSSLTDSYNQQRSVVNLLKSDMEKLQDKIKAQLAEVESFKMEYANARLECNAADERANILASEVIGLEEKALRLRSNELKLERQLDNSQAEISSLKKKMSSLEKERQDFQSTIEALQEEKKVLQSKLRKASFTGKSIDVITSPASKKDISTSTEDIASTDASSDDRELNNTNDASSSSWLHENGQFEASSVYMPPDQMRMIQNINSLISELTLEKEELTKSLSSELSQSSKLKELNKDLSRKLEAQTQRLELLTAQNMASEHMPVRQPELQTIYDNTPYADEGDEVVERVLGWIMKLFPGGPTRRRPNKRLSY